MIEVCWSEAEKRFCISFFLLSLLYLCLGNEETVVNSRDGI